MNSSDRATGRQFAIALLAGCTALLVYFPTASRSLGWHDAAELAYTAWALGASHAPGSPMHSVLGFLTTRIATEPFQGVVLLSVFTASIAAGLLALLLYLLRPSFSIALAAAMVFALSFQVWAAAVATEVYSLSMLFLAAAILSGWLWRAHATDKYFVAMLCAYALALASYFGNILLLPAFLYLAWMAPASSRRYLTFFVLGVALTTVLIGLANYLLAKNAAPFGEIYPDSIWNLILYMTGSQHDPLQFRDVSFILMRIAEHAAIFTRSIFYLGVPLAAVGAYYMDRLDRVFGLFILGIFAIYIGYYTLFGPGDYYMMVIPAYFVAALWVGLGGAYLSDKLSRPWGNMLGWLCPAVLAAGLLLMQFDGRRAMAVAMDSERFAEIAFAVLPENAIAITGWKEYAVLNYFQAVHGRRPDVRVVVPARTRRQYSHGEVQDYLEFIAVSICDGPVFTTKNLPEMQPDFDLLQDDDTAPWALMRPRTECQQ